MHCKVDPRTLGSDLFQQNFDPDVWDLTDVGAGPNPDMSVAQVGAGRSRFAQRFDPDCNSVLGQQLYTSASQITQEI